MSSPVSLARLHPPHSPLVYLIQNEYVRGPSTQRPASGSDEIGSSCREKVIHLVPTTINTWLYKQRSVIKNLFHWPILTLSANSFPGRSRSSTSYTAPNAPSPRIFVTFHRPPTQGSADENSTALVPCLLPSCMFYVALFSKNAMKTAVISEYSTHHLNFNHLHFLSTYISKTTKIRNTHKDNRIKSCSHCLNNYLVTNPVHFVVFLAPGHWCCWSVSGSYMTPIRSCLTIFKKRFSLAKI